MFTSTHLRGLLALLLAGLGAAALYLAPAAGAHHGDIHATCNGDTPVVSIRPPGTEHIQVVCRDGLPEFVVNPGNIATYDPVSQAKPQATPPDFGGWVTVWLNGKPLKTPYDPIRGVQEPGAYLAASTGRVMMPIRFFTEAFGGQADWNQQEKRARLVMIDRSKVLMVWPGQTQASVNLDVVKLDQTPVVFQERLFVPVRFLAEGFGAEVKWDHANRSARITMAGASCANPVYCGEVR